MRSKRFWTLLMAAVMVFSLISPAAAAGTPGRKPASAESTNLPQAYVGPAGGAVAYQDDAASQADDAGQWVATQVDVDLHLAQAQLPDCIQELREAAEIYADTDQVAAFVVMEDAPTSEIYGSILDVPAQVEQALLDIQNRIIAQIEEWILGGRELDVRYQFTYLTNSFTINTAFGNLEEIARMEDVKSVFLMPVYEAMTVEEGTISPNTISSGQMTGVDQVWQELGYTGAGMKIAIIDTGLDLDHPSFASDPATNANSMTLADVAAVLPELNVAKLDDSVTAEELYRSAKVPFAFNYAEGNLVADHSQGYTSEHGTHVAGIAAANAVEGSGVVGMAPDAQIIVMKVFQPGGGAQMDDINAAIEDAMRLGCDVGNASLGATAGFSSSDSELDLIYQRIAQQDMVMCFAAGNEGTSALGNLWGTNLNRTQNPDNASVGEPSTYANVMSVASADNSTVKAKYFVLADGSELFYDDPYEYDIGMDALADQALEYVVLDGLGNPEDFLAADGSSLVEGKIAVIARGELNFGTKIFNAQAAGAVAVVIWNSQAETVNMNITGEDGVTLPQIPACLVSQADGQIMADAAAKTLTVSAQLGDRENVGGGQMSSFSSWGPSPDLRLLPDITGIGGDVYSCYDGGGYGLMSGTSMATPQVAGVTALVKEYLKEIYPDGANDGTLRELAEAMLMSTADPIINAESGAEESPRHQGAGLVNAYEALTAGAYLTVAGGRPKAELGDSSTGVYAFQFEVHNVSDEAKTYVLDASLLTEYVAAMELGEDEYEYFMYGCDVSLDGTVSFDAQTVTVAPGGTETVNVTISLADSDKEYFDAYWENGGYVEGYVYLNVMSDEGAVTGQLNLPFLGFYGDWTQAPVFDSAFWYDNSFWGAGDGIPEGDQYYTVMWTDLGGENWVLGFNPYSGAMGDENGNVIYDPANNLVSPNGDGYLDGLDLMYVSLLRNAKTMTLTYTVDGQVMQVDEITNVSKSYYYNGSMYPWISGNYGVPMYDFTDANGDVLPSGTEVLLTIEAEVDYADGGDHSIQIPITVDTDAPTLVSVEQRQLSDGRQALYLEAADTQALASIVLMNPSGTQIYGQVYDFQLSPSGAGTYEVGLNITGLGTEFLVAVCDYAANETYYTLEYEIDGGNLPEMDDSQLYGYRLYDDQISGGHDNGWVSMNKPGSSAENTNITVWTDDAYEPSAIYASAQVGGKVFAIDEYGTFLVMEPGLYNRQVICALPLDGATAMTFDDTTDTMYVAGADGGVNGLYTLDIMTGELACVKHYGDEPVPTFIACDNSGTIYAVSASDPVLYCLDEAYSMVSTGWTVTDSNGSPVNPNYMQGMIWADGKLYWTYFTEDADWNLFSEMLVLDLAAQTSFGSTYTAQAYDGSGNLVEYYPITQIAALHSLKPTEYQIPAATAISGVYLTEDSGMVLQGGTLELGASPLPWNYEPEQVLWRSSDETVATVEGGLITGVGLGEAIITVTMDGVGAEFHVTVVSTDTSFYAYTLYSPDGSQGYMVQVDTGEMDYEMRNQSPVEFWAGDYNGQDGCFYGYDEHSQFWKYDLETNDAQAVGGKQPLAVYDMAYDYTTGLMYAMAVDEEADVYYLCLVDLATGALEPIDLGDEEYMTYGSMTLACDGNGDLYTIDIYGGLYYWQMDDSTFEALEYVMSVPGEPYYVQSMCWDYGNNVLLWDYCDGNTLIWIDPVAGYCVELGSPTGSIQHEYVGMYTIPETIPVPPVEGEMDNPFTDVQESDYFYTPVMWAVGSGITSGTSATTFSPNAGATRAQTVTFLWTAVGRPAPSGGTENPFTDVKATDYYYNAVMWAMENGVTAGVSATKFGSDLVCTRAQTMTFLWRALGQPKGAGESGFSDVHQTDYFYEAVAWAVEQGVTSGTSATTFSPNAKCTRAQIVTFLYAALN